LRINAHHHPSDGACSAPARGRRLCRSRCRSAPVREPEFPDAGGDLRHLLVASDPASPLGASKKPLPTLSWNDTPASTAGRSGGSGSGLAAQALTEALAPRRSHLRVLGKPTWRSGRGGRSNAESKKLPVQVRALWQTRKRPCQQPLPPRRSSRDWRRALPPTRRVSTKLSCGKLVCEAASVHHGVRRCGGVVAAR
jgi:hypothetical protein